MHVSVSGNQHRAAQVNTLLCVYRAKPHWVRVWPTAIQLPLRAVCIAPAAWCILLHWRYDVRVAVYPRLLRGSPVTCLQKCIITFMFSAM
jgi:hypothetical protein